MIKSGNIYEEIYKANIGVLLGGTLEELKAFMLSKHPNFDTSGAFRIFGWGKQLTATSSDGVNSHYIWFREWSNPKESLPTLHHETIHLAVAILYERGLSFSESSEEAFTYYSEALFRAVWNMVEQLNAPE